MPSRPSRFGWSNLVGASKIRKTVIGRTNRVYEVYRRPPTRICVIPHRFWRCVKQSIREILDAVTLNNVEFRDHMHLALEL